MCHQQQIVVCGQRAAAIPPRQGAPGMVKGQAVDKQAAWPMEQSASSADPIARNCGDALHQRDAKREIACFTRKPRRAGWRPNDDEVARFYPCWSSESVQADRCARTRIPDEARAYADRDQQGRSGGDRGDADPVRSWPRPATEWTTNFQGRRCDSARCARDAGSAARARRRASSVA